MLHLVLAFFCGIIEAKAENFEMSKRNSLFVVAVLSALVCSANAAPSVKMLGTKKSGSGEANSTLKLSSQTSKKTVPVSRLGSVKVTNLQNSKTVNKVATVKTGGGNDANNRLSVGKYIHTGGIQSNLIKPATQTVPVVSSDDFLNLQDRVQRVETELSMKQNALQAGDGVIIEDNVLSLSQDVNGLVADVNSLKTQMDGKADLLNVTNNYYTKSEVTDLLNAHGLGDNNTVYDAGHGVRNYVTFVDVFDEGIFE